MHPKHCLTANQGVALSYAQKKNQVRLRDRVSFHPAFQKLNKMFIFVIIFFERLTLSIINHRFTLVVLECPVDSTLYLRGFKTIVYMELLGVYIYGTLGISVSLCTMPCTQPPSPLHQHRHLLGKRSINVIQNGYKLQPHSLCRKTGRDVMPNGPILLKYCRQLRWDWSLDALQRSSLIRSGSIHWVNKGGIFHHMGLQRSL